MITENSLFKLISKKTDLINAIVEGLESKVQQSQVHLLRFIVEEFLEKFDFEEGKFLNNAKNKRLIAVIDEIYSKFNNSVGVENIKLMITGVQKIVNFNKNYFQMMVPKTVVAPLHAGVIENVNAWLGVTTKGDIKPNGYLDTLIKDPTIKNEIRNQVVTAVVTQSGYNETKKQLGEYIQGKPDESTGAMQRYFRNFVYDTFSHVDRANGQMIAEGLKLQYAIYEGGVIKTTRPFCRSHNGKVFSRDEISEFDPKTAKPPGYNPFVDLGGYGCRHHLNWIPEALAKALRPDLPALKPADLDEEPKQI